MCGLRPIPRRSRPRIIGPKPLRHRRRIVRRIREGKLQNLSHLRSIPHGGELDRLENAIRSRTLPIIQHQIRIPRRALRIQSRKVLLERASFLVGAVVLTRVRELVRIGLADVNESVLFGVFFRFVDVFSRFEAGEVEGFVFWWGGELSFAVVEGRECGFAAGEVVGCGDGGCLHDGGKEEEEREKEGKASEAAETLGR